MRKVVIDGGRTLSGRISVQKSVTSSLALIPAALLSDETVVIRDVPDVDDVSAQIDIAKVTGADICRGGQDVSIRYGASDAWVIPDAWSRRLRSSLLFVGAAVGRQQRARIGYPGGGRVATRPLNLHLKSLRALGANMDVDGGEIHVRPAALSGARIYLDYPSVSVTMNVILAAARAEGRTQLINAARDPEIVDLANLLNRMGGRVVGAGTSEIRIDGTSDLGHATHRPIPDRIVAGTWLLAGAMNGGEIWVDDCIPEHLASFLSQLRDSGVDLTIGEDVIGVSACENPLPLEIRTGPYPGLPSGLQPALSVFLGRAKGYSLVQENLREDRLDHLMELRRMGLMSDVEGRLAVIRGETRWTGAPVVATDNRMAGALVLAGLIADGCTEIEGVNYLDRSYADIVPKLRQLGASIEVVLSDGIGSGQGLSSRGFPQGMSPSDCLI